MAGLLRLLGVVIFENSQPEKQAVGEPGALPSRLGPWRRGVRETGLGFVVLGVVVLLFVTYQLFGTSLTEEHSQGRLKQSFNEAVAAQAHRSGVTGSTGARSEISDTGASNRGGKVGGSRDSRSGQSDDPRVAAAPKQGPSAAIPSGLAIDHLIIPSIGVDRYVVQGVAEADLAQGPGHYPNTVLPGQVGNAAIAGHRTTYGAPFFRLDDVKVGDPIYVTDTAGMRYVYQVTALEVVSPGDTSVLDTAPVPELTLTTCNPRYSDTSRLVILALLTASNPLPAGATTRTPSAVTPTPTAPASTTPTSTAATSGSAATTRPGRPASEVSPSGSSAVANRPEQVSGGRHLAMSTVTGRVNLGKGDEAGWPSAIAYAAAVVALWVLARLAINRTRRWRRLAAYVVGIGLCLVPLWLCFENVVRLLPTDI